MHADQSLSFGPRSLFCSCCSAVLRLWFLLLGLVVATTAHAQWQATTYTLRGGWNAIYLHGDATHATLDQLFADHPEVLSVWRWNPNPNPLPTGNASIVPSSSTPNWSVWTRGQPGQSTLGSLVGQAAYLIECGGAATSTYAVQLTHRTAPPQSTWVRNGANLLGFPTRQSGDYPSFSSYFATFPAAVASNSKIYKYVGGPLGPANPLQVFSLSSERLDRTQAYWFEAPVVGNFYAPLEITSSLPEGLHFGRTGASLTVRIRNRTSAPVTVTISPENSLAAPAGQPQISGAVPLTRRVFNAASGQTTETLLTGSFNEVVGPQSAIELTFGLQRAQMTAPSGALYASFLRFTDSGNLLDIALPASATVTSLAGLWIGDIAVNRVESKAPGSPGTTTSRPFPLRVLLHVDDGGQARLLSQAFLGPLAASPTLVGLATREAALHAPSKASATRFVSTQLPLDTEVSTGSGSVALGGTLTRTFAVGFNDRVNPFVHTYHPDHDNRDARLQPLGAGVESFTVTRACTFDFAATPPAGTNGPGWGASVIGGTYTETLTGLHKQSITVTGTFELRRVSEIGAITLN
jgi:hypothetical protein